MKANKYQESKLKRPYTSFQILVRTHRQLIIKLTKFSNQKTLQHTRKNLRNTCEKLNE